MILLHRIQADNEKFTLCMPQKIKTKELNMLRAFIIDFFQDVFQEELIRTLDCRTNNRERGKYD